MNETKSFKLLLISIFSMFSYLIGAEAILPTRAATDEPLVLPDILTLVETGKLPIATYFSGVGYQFQTVFLLKITGLSPDSLQILSPAIAGIAFATFFIILYRIYINEVNKLWWGFLPVLISTVVFPGFVNRMWESTHKAYTFILLFVTIYVIYRASKWRSNYQYMILVGIFLIGIGLLNYIWGIVYAVLVGAIALAYQRTRWYGFAASVVSGIVNLIAPAVSPLRRYHRTYFSAFRSKVNQLSPGLIKTQDTGSSVTNTSSGTDTTAKSVLLDRMASGDGSTAVGSAGNTLGRISEWPTVEIIGLTISSWYIYSLGIGLVAALTAGAGLLCAYSFLRKQLSALGILTFIVLLYSSILGMVFIMIGDIATFKRIIVLPGVIGTLFFTVYIIYEDSRPQRVSKHRQLFLVSLTILLLITAGLSTHRSLVNGGDIPIDRYVNQAEVHQTEWITRYGITESCYFVRQKVVVDYYGKQNVGNIKSFSVNPELVDVIYQSTPRDRTATACT